MRKMTEQEQKVYDYILSSINERGYAPSVRDIMNALGFRSTSTVHAYISRLNDLGMISKDDGKSRALHIDGGKTSDLRVPLLGKVTAGKPILAEEDFEGYVAFDAGSVGCRREDMFALRIKGESMIGAGILDGDIVIVERRNYAENGEIVVAMIEDEATVKTFFRENGRFRLQPENPDMKPLIADEVAVLGKVVASLRLY